MLYNTGHYNQKHFAKRPLCQVSCFYIVMLGVIMLIVIMANVIMLNVVAPNKYTQEIIIQIKTFETLQHSLSFLCRLRICKFYIKDTWGLYYKTFYSCNLQISVIS
jgi:hypothetical protein